MLYKFIQYLFAALLPFLLFSCERELSYENGGTPGSGISSGTAVFAFDGAPGTCIGANVFGTYKAGVPLTTDDSVVVDVTVTVAGTYNISTALVNGISFLGAGSFDTTGLFTITLRGSGTPTTGGTFSYVPGRNGCGYAVTVVPTTTPPVFTGQFTAKVNGTLTTFNVTQATLLRSTATNEKRFDLTGISIDSSIRFSIAIGDTTAIGNNVSLGAHPVRFDLVDDPTTPGIDESVNTDALYALATHLSPGDNWLTDVYKLNGLINISTNTPGVTTGTISGTFSGTLSNFTTGIVTYNFTEGQFTNITYFVLN